MTQEDPRIKPVIQAYQEFGAAADPTPAPAKPSPILEGEIMPPTPSHQDLSKKFLQVIVERRAVVLGLSKFR